MGINSKKQKLESIEKQLSALLCFSTQENEEYIKRLRKFPEEGLDMFLKFLNEAKEEQDKFFAETLKRNPEFIKAFSRFLNQTTAHIKEKFETKESGNAESILKGIS